MCISNFNISDHILHFNVFDDGVWIITCYWVDFLKCFLRVEEEMSLKLFVQNHEWNTESHSKRRMWRNRVRSNNNYIVQNIFSRDSDLKTCVVCPFVRISVHHQTFHQLINWLSHQLTLFIFSSTNHGF